MRKLLLASAAGLGVWGASDAAFAQATTTTTTTTVTPGYQQPINPTTTMGGMALPAAASPNPGTIVVRLNGRVRFYAFWADDRDGDNNAAGTSTGTVSATTGLGTATGGNKTNNYGFAEYARLYPGFDGVAANGLKYGANLEIRQDQNHSAGGGAFSSISAEGSQRGTLYFRRDWGYLGSNSFGTIRVGSTDQPTSLYMTGNFENFDDGGLNGDLPGFMNQAVAPIWPFQDVGNFYTTNKVVYLSPSFAGFDFGVSYEPSTANLSAQTGCGAGNYAGTNFTNPAGTFTAASGANSSGATSPGCDRLSSSPSNAESARRKNTFDALIRYRGSFGPVGLAATAAYMGGGHVLDNQTGIPYNNNPLVGTLRRQYQGWDNGDFGVAVTIGGLSFGGKEYFGRYNGQGATTVTGVPDAHASLVGFSYTFPGMPLIVGAHGLLFESPGDLSNAYFGRDRREQGIASGATYDIAPGVSLWLSGIYYERKQNGYNFVTGQTVSAATPGGNPYSNKVSGSIVAIGTAFSW